MAVTEIDCKFIGGLSSDVIEKFIDRTNLDEPRQVFLVTNTDDVAQYKAHVPADLAGTITAAKVLVKWSTPATSGDIVLRIDRRYIADGETYNVAKTNGSDTSGITVPGTADFRKDTEITVTNPAKDDACYFDLVARQADTGNYTLADELHIEEVKLILTH